MVHILVFICSFHCFKIKMKNIQSIILFDRVGTACFVLFEAKEVRWEFFSHESFTICIRLFVYSFAKCSISLIRFSHSGASLFDLNASKYCITNTHTHIRHSFIRLRRLTHTDASKYCLRTHSQHTTCIRLFVCFDWLTQKHRIFEWEKRMSEWNDRSNLLNEYKWIFWVFLWVILIRFMSNWTKSFLLKLLLESNEEFLANFFFGTLFYFISTVDWMVLNMSFIQLWTPFFKPIS